MSILNNTGLETLDYNLPGWNFIFNRNFELLAKTLLKVNSMLDVVKETPNDGAILVWNAALSKFEFKYWS